MDSRPRASGRISAVLSFACLLLSCSEPPLRTLTEVDLSKGDQTESILEVERITGMRFAEPSLSRIQLLMVEPIPSFFDSGDRYRAYVRLSGSPESLDAFVGANRFETISKGNNPELHSDLVEHWLTDIGVPWRTPAPEWWRPQEVWSSLFASRRIGGDFAFVISGLVGSVDDSTKAAYFVVKKRSV